MGRYYSGNINGKFWFGCQSSGAMENYGAIAEDPEFRFKSCGCRCMCVPDDEKPIYCEDCFNSYEDHIKEVRDETDDDDDTECFEEDETGGNFMYDKDMFEDQGLPFIEEHKDLFNKYIESITFDDDDDYAYEIKWTKEEYAKTFNDDDKIIADLCMLKQIQRFFEKEECESCEWYAEY